MNFDIPSRIIVESCVKLIVGNSKQVKSISVRNVVVAVRKKADEELATHIDIAIPATK